MQTSNVKQKTCSVLGVALAVTDYGEAAATVHAWALAARPESIVRTVSAANTHVVTLARHDRQFGKALAGYDLVVPDGMPLIWIMNRQGAALGDRVYGPTLMLHVLKLPGISHFFLGGSESLLETLSGKLKQQFPALRLAGAYSPPFSPDGVWSDEENERILRKIEESGAECIWVGLGCPKQEYWIARNRASLPPGVYFAIGAAFAFHAGLVRQAPKWMQDRGLEWIFRLVTEPRRLWKRYVVHNTLFLWYLLVDGCRTKSRRTPAP